MARKYQRARNSDLELEDRDRRRLMENWKKAVLAGSGGAAAICLVKGSRTGIFIFGGIALATLASEYPEKLAEIRRKLPQYIDHGTTLLEVASRIGERLAEVTERRGSAWFESLLESRN
jgi:hypothetical protein